MDKCYVLCARVVPLCCLLAALIPYALCQVFMNVSLCQRVCAVCVNAVCEFFRKYTHARTRAYVGHIENPRSMHSSSPTEVASQYIYA